MGFWSSLGHGLAKVGKIAAPIATAMIPGIGPILAPMVGGAIGAADKKMHGGSWGDALKGGITGAISGIGPTNPGSLIGKSVKGTIGNVGKATAKTMLGMGGQQGNPYMSDDPARGGISGNMGGWGNIAKNAAMGIGNAMGNRVGNNGQGIGPSPQMSMAMPRQSYGMDQSNPNLATSLEAGRMAALGPNYNPIPYSSVPQRKRQ